VRQARASQQECNNQCAVFLLQAGMYWGCLKKCMSGRGMKTDEMQDFSTPSLYPGVSAQPINPGQFFASFYHLSLRIMKKFDCKNTLKS